MGANMITQKQLDECLEKLYAELDKSEETGHYNGKSRHQIAMQIADKIGVQVIPVKEYEIKRFK